MRFRRFCTLFALGLSLLMTTGCVMHRCCRHRPLFHRRIRESCGCETCGYRPACECGMPVPMTTVVPGASIAPMPGPTIVTPSH